MNNPWSYLHEKLDHLLGLPQSEKAVGEIKENATKQVNDVTESLKKQGKLQNLVIQRTTTYYIGKAAGVIK